MQSSVTSAYYVALHTLTDYDMHEYDAAAGALLDVLVSILSSKETLGSLLHGEFITAKSEIEASLDPPSERPLPPPNHRELVARAVIEVTATTPVKFDKQRFSKIVKAHKYAHVWPELKILKRIAPVEL